MLHKEPAGRYRTAAALADDLGRFQRGEPISARRVGFFERFRKWVRRHPGPAIAGTSVAMLVAIAALTIERFLWNRAELLRGMNDDLAAIARFEHAAIGAMRTRRWEHERGRLGEQDVSNAHGRFTSSERDFQLVTDLWAIRLNRAEVAGEKLRPAEAAAHYEKTFDAAGLNVQALPTATTAERINASPIRNELIAGLDDWATCAVSMTQLEKIYDVAQRADPDPRWRNKVRDASIIQNVQALTDLATAAPVAEQSASILVALGHQIDLAKGNSVPFCRRVQLQYPNDFWANLLLAMVLQERRNAESINYYLAAQGDPAKRLDREHQPGCRTELSREKRQRARLRPTRCADRSALGAGALDPWDLPGATRQIRRGRCILPERACGGSEILFRGRRNVPGTDQRRPTCRGECSGSEVSPRAAEK